MKKQADPGVPFAAQLSGTLPNAFHTNNRINQYLIENVSEEAWKAKPPGGKGRTIAAVVAHMHNVRVMWLKVSAKGTEISEQLDRSTVTSKQATKALELSCEALTELMKRALESDGRIKGFRPDVAGFFGYLIAHDATTAARSPCWLGNSAILCRRRSSLACGSGAHAERAVHLQSRLLLQSSGTIQLRILNLVNRIFSIFMRKAVLLYNPDSGGRGSRRRDQLQAVLALLRETNVECELVLSTSRADAKDNARQAVQSGCDTVFACGGDGTIHNIVQILANTQVALAILPMGTANALAHDIGLPGNVLEAARSALQGVPRRIALGRIRCLDPEGKPRDRFFAVAAGVGTDAHLFYKLRAGHKQRMGMAAYYAQAWHLWFTHPMTRFQVEFPEIGSQELRWSDVTEVLAVRIRNFGGVLQELAPGASLERDDLRLVMCRTDSRLAYLAYVARGLLRSSWKISGIDLAHSQRASCTYLAASDPGNENAAKIYVEADGELLGTLPAEITVVPDALTILAPSR